MSLLNDRDYTDKMFYGITVVVSIILSVYIFIFYKDGLMMPFWIDVFTLFFIIPLSLIIFPKNNFVARYILLIGLNIMLYVPSIGLTLTNQNYFFPLVAMNALLFRTSERKSFYFSYIITGTFLYLSMMQIDFLGIGVWSLDDSFNLELHRQKNMVGGIVLSVILLNLLRKNISLVAEKYIEKEKQKQKELEEQRQINYHKEKLASVGKLSAGVAHEINNPLAFIKGYVNRIAKEVPEHKDKTDKILIGVKRIQNIVKGLLCFTSNTEAQLQECSVKDALEESYLLLEEMYRVKGISLKKEFVSEDVQIFADRGKFQQIIMNLLSNAKDALDDEAEKVITLGLKAEDSKVSILVEDTGCGMSEEVKNRIFEPFFSTKEIGKGTGIGMGLVYSYVKDMEGSIDIESKEGEGTRFFLKIPKV